METSREQACGATAILAAAGLGLQIGLASPFGLRSWVAVIPYLLLTLTVTLAGWVRARLTRRAEEERLDQARARRERSAAALFEPPEAGEPFSAARNLAIFDRTIGPALAPLLALIAGYGAWLLRHSFTLPVRSANGALAAAAVSSVEAFAFYLTSRFLLALSRRPDSGELRGPGLFAGLTSLTLLAAAAGAVCSKGGWPRGDVLIAGGLTVLLALLAIEELLYSVFQFYRSRPAGAPGAAWESRLAALLVDPSIWSRSLSQMLDYQFGFAFSATWFYRFLKNAFVPYLALQTLVLGLLSCMVCIGPGEEGIRERFGRVAPEGWRLESGFHVKWPWPLETVRRCPANRVQTLQVGYRDSAPRRHRVLLWTVPHYEHEDLFLTAARDATSAASDREAAVPVGFLSVNMPIEYRITNILQFIYEHAQPERIIHQLAVTAVSQELAGRDVFDVLASGHLETAGSIERRLQEAVAHHRVGVQILFVGLQGLHPPVPVAPAFQSVVSAEQTREAARLRAVGYGQRVVPRAEAESVAIIRAAEAYRFERAALAAAEAEAFDHLRKADRGAPHVFRPLWRMRTVRDALADARKFIVASAPAREVLQFDFEEKSQPDLFDLVQGPGAMKRDKP